MFSSRNKKIELPSISLFYFSFQTRSFVPALEVMSNGPPCLPPGFRFHPTDEELILHYLCKRLEAAPFPASIIADVDIYKFNPWELPEKALFGDREWYFFSPRDRKYPNGIRPNRAAASGYWKATGTDKPITTSEANENIGVKKALVFYKGKPPKGEKTNWIMHEYRLFESQKKISKSRPLNPREDSMRLDDWVLCRIYQKNNYHPSPDQMHEDSAGDEASMQSSTINKNMHKSFSLSELLEEADISLLSRLLETPSNTTVLDQSPFQSTNLIKPSTEYMGSTNSSYLTSQVQDSEGSRFVPENSWKRQRLSGNYDFDVFAEYMNPSKKFNICSSYTYDQLSNQFDCSQPFFYQQL